MTARLKHPVYFTEHLVFIRNKIEYTIAYNHIGLISRYRHVLNITLAEFNIVQSQFFCIGSCFADHGRCKIDPHHFALFPHNTPGNKSIVTGTAAEVTPIRELDRIELGCGSRGPITEKIQSAFFDIVNGRNPKYAHWLTKV